MTSVQVDKIDLFLTNVGHTFKNDPAGVGLVLAVRDAHQRGRLFPWVTVAWSEVHRPAVFFAADGATAKAKVVLLRGERGWSADMWSMDLGPLAAQVGARIENGRVVG